MEQEELLKEEINALREILAHQEQTEQAGMNQWTSNQTDMIIADEYLVKYQDKDEEELRAHLDRLKRDLSDLESNEF